jgi:hypothetical protein
LITRQTAGRGPRQGYTLLEVTITSTLFVVVMLASVALLERDRTLSRSMLNMSHVEQMSQDMLFNLERELANACGATPVAFTPPGLPIDGTEVRVNSTVGFPPQGSFVIDRGTAREVIAYSGLEETQELLLGLERGQQCTLAVDHDELAELLWAGLAEVLEEQPPADLSAADGVALEDHGPVYFRGIGTGFSYRVPVDPGGKLKFLTDDEVTWGASVPGAALAGATDGWSAIYFEPRLLFEEATHKDDINKDGDTSDVFDIGQLKKVVWNVVDPGQKPAYVGLGPTNVLQERCNHGSDLDHDGFEDPMFLWDSKFDALHVRLFLIGLSNVDAPVTRKVESVMFLRNSANSAPELETEI